MHRRAPAKVALWCAGNIGLERSGERNRRLRHMLLDVNLD
jgi:hypothetical protein